MKKIKLIFAVLVAASVFCLAACSNTSGGSGSSEPSNPFDGTSWYGDTQDFFYPYEVRTDVKLLVFDKVDYNGTTICRCENVEDLFFGGDDNFRLQKGQKLPYDVERKSDGSYVATTQIFKYSIVIPDADSTTGYIAVEHENKILKINITKK